MRAATSELLGAALAAALEQGALSTSRRTSSMTLATSVRRIRCRAPPRPQRGGPSCDGVGSPAWRCLMYRMFSRLHVVGWALTGALAIALIGALAGVVRSGPLDPPGPPSSTTIEAVVKPAPGRIIVVAEDVVLHAGARCGQPCARRPSHEFVRFGFPTDTATPTSTTTPIDSPTPGPGTPPAGVTDRPFATVDVSDCNGLDVFASASLVNPAVYGSALVRISFATALAGSSGFTPLSVDRGNYAAGSLDLFPYLDEQRASAKLIWGAVDGPRSPNLAVYLLRTDSQPADAVLSLSIYCSY